MALADKDRIFTNLYGYQPWNLDAARVRGDWDNTKALLDKGVHMDASGKFRHSLALPAYEQVIKASHNFNLLDARGAISVTERQSYILRVRELAKACGAAYLRTAGGGAAW